MSLTPEEILRLESRVMDDVVLWLKENIADYEWDVGEDGRSVLILSEEDAIMFKLRFGV